MLSTNKVITERKNVLDELLMERYDLAKNRICEICTEKSAQPDFEDFFKLYGGIPEENSCNS